MLTIPAILSNAADRWGERPAMAAQDGAISFRALDWAASRAARAFMASGLGTGDKVAVWAPNMWEWVAAAVGAQRVGGVIVPLNTRLRGGEVADVMRRSDARFLVAIGDFLGQYYPAMLDGEIMPGPPKTIVLGHARAGDIGWEAFLAIGDTLDDAAYAARTAAIGPDDIADIMFTSGTTGSPKGAVFDHARSVRGGRAWADICGLQADDRYCCFGPFSHNASYKAGWVSSLMTGATLYWPERYDPVSILSLIADNRITVMPAPPTIWMEALAHPARADWDTSSLRYISTGATTIPTEMVRRLRRDMNVPVIATGYGMTECCGTATMTRPEDDPALVIHTVGRAIDGTEVRVADQDGRTVPMGEAGEVLIRDHKLFIEYLGNAEATRMTLDAEGWLHSGDVGVMGADGYLTITDRIKDMYIVGGFNVYPAEIERQMSALPGLHHCAIIGVPDGRLGEVGHAFIVRARGSTLSEAEVIAWSRRNLANYKVPRGVTFVDELPMNATGKVLKFALQNMV